jgi:hypothetical protein
MEQQQGEEKDTIFDKHVEQDVNNQDKEKQQPNKWGNPYIGLLMGALFIGLGIMRIKSGSVVWLGYFIFIFGIARIIMSILSLINKK